MCARFTLYTESRLIAERFQLAALPSLMPRYNIAPSQPLPVIGTKAGGQGRGLAMFRWGFIPHWAQDGKVGTEASCSSAQVWFARLGQCPHGPRSRASRRRYPLVDSSLRRRFEPSLLPCHQRPRRWRKLRRLSRRTKDRRGSTWPVSTCRKF